MMTLHKYFVNIPDWINTWNKADYKYNNVCLSLTHVKYKQH